MALFVGDVRGVGGHCDQSLPAGKGRACETKGEGDEVEQGREPMAEVGVRNALAGFMHKMACAAITLHRGSLDLRGELT